VPSHPPSDPPPPERCLTPVHCTRPPPAISHSVSAAACATGNYCITNAADHISRGDADLMLAGKGNSQFSPNTASQHQVMAPYWRRRKWAVGLRNLLMPAWLVCCVLQHSMMPAWLVCSEPPTALLRTATFHELRQGPSWGVLGSGLSHVTMLL
jgi:hypothetical protein